MASQGELLRAAALLLDGRGSATVLSAMSPRQPNDLISALLSEALRKGILLTLLIADLSGRWDFVSAEHEPSLRSGRLRLVSLAGGIPKRLSASIDHYPNSLYDIDRYIADGTLAADIFVARVSQIDPASGFALGDMVGYTPAALSRIECVGFEVEVGPGPVGGYPPIGRERPDVVCAAHPRERVVVNARTRSPAHARIGRLVSELLPDDATLQLGVGAVPEAVVPHLAGRKRLGLHSGILPQSLQPLIAAGAFSGTRKSHDVGLQVATGVLCQPGTTWVDSVRLQPISVTHSPDVLNRQHRLWAVNSAFEVDLLGQVNAEYAGCVRIASGGGQADFFRAAHQSNGGAAVLALPARTTSGRSRIVGSLSAPHHVTSPAGDLDVVVTEFGVAELRSARASERAERLIAIAHPDDRNALRREWSRANG